MITWFACVPLFLWFAYAVQVVDILTTYWEGENNGLFGKVGEGNTMHFMDFLNNAAKPHGLLQQDTFFDYILPCVFVMLNVISHSQGRFSVFAGVWDCTKEDNSLYRDMTTNNVFQAKCR